MHIHRSNTINYQRKDDEFPTLIAQCTLPGRFKRIIGTHVTHVKKEIFSHTDDCWNSNKPCDGQCSSSLQKVPVHTEYDGIFLDEANQYLENGDTGKIIDLFYSWKYDYSSRAFVSDMNLLSEYTDRMFNAQWGDVPAIAFAELGRLLKYITPYVGSVTQDNDRIYVVVNQKTQKKVQSTKIILNSADIVTLWYNCNRALCGQKPMKITYDAVHINLLTDAIDGFYNNYNNIRILYGRQITKTKNLTTQDIVNQLQNVISSARNTQDGLTYVNDIISKISSRFDVKTVLNTIVTYACKDLKGGKNRKNRMNIKEKYNDLLNDANSAYIQTHKEKMDHCVQMVHFSPYKIVKVCTANFSTFLVNKKKAMIEAKKELLRIATENAHKKQCEENEKRIAQQNAVKNRERSRREHNKSTADSDSHWRTSRRSTSSRNNEPSRRSRRTNDNWRRTSTSGTTGTTARARTTMTTRTTRTTTSRRSSVASRPGAYVPPAMR
jgi:hypothetical protein